MMSACEMPMHWWALGALFFYSLLSLILGETFPFSRYGMYAVTAARRAGTVPVFLADGRQAPIERYTSFSGIDPQRIDPPPFTCSLQWRVHEMRRWLLSHQAGLETPAGPVEVQLGYRIVALSSSGKLAEAFKAVARGRAWPLN